MSTLHACVNEIEALKAKQDAIDVQIRSVYARVATAGYDKTSVGQVITIRRKHRGDAQAFADASAVVQSYLVELGWTAEANVSPRACTRESKDRAKPENEIKRRARELMASAKERASGNGHADPDIPAFMRRA